MKLRYTGGNEAQPWAATGIIIADDGTNRPVAYEISKDPTSGEADGFVVTAGILRMEEGAELEADLIASGYFYMRDGSLDDAAGHVYTDADQIRALSLDATWNAGRFEGDDQQQYKASDFSSREEFLEFVTGGVTPGLKL